MAKLVEWAGEIKTRKLLQKVIYLLQAAGCPFDAEYSLHLYGPYSQDVAQLTDEMVGVGLLEEEKKSNMVRGSSYSYRLGEKARQSLHQLDESGKSQPWLDKLNKYQSKAQNLFKESDLKKIEFAATIVYFHKQGFDWEKALQAAAKFKDQKPTNQKMQEALKLAETML